jgi:hypothetical protein
LLNHFHGFLYGTLVLLNIHQKLALKLATSIWSRGVDGTSFFHSVMHTRLRYDFFLSGMSASLVFIILFTVANGGKKEKAAIAAKPTGST